MIGFVQGSNPNKMQAVSGPTVIAPQSQFAVRTSGYKLTLATVTGGVHLFRRATQQGYFAGFNGRVQRKSRSCFALAPATMTAMNHQRRAFHLVADVAAITTALQGVGHDKVSGEPKVCIGDNGYPISLNTSHGTRFSRIVPIL